MENTVNNQEAYLVEYKKFIEEYKRSEVSGEEVGEVIARLANYFAMFNMRMVADDRRLSLVARDIEGRADESGKPISSSKAKIYTDATDEANDFRISRAHLQNIEQMINSLKSLQKGVLQEYSHLGNS